MSATRDGGLIKYRTNKGTIAICDYSLSTALMRLVGTRARQWFYCKTAQVYLLLLLTILINNYATTRFLFNLRKWVI